MLEPTALIILIIVGVAAVVFFVMYNTVIGRKNAVENAFAGMDAILKKRYDLIPNLVASVKEYMGHEADVLKDITALRAKATSGNISSDEAVALNNSMQSALSGLMVQVEAYPDLKASENFIQLQRSLNEVEEQLSAARRAFNAAVTDFNNTVEMFPTNIVAGMMGQRRRKLFEIPDKERENVNVGGLFNS